MIPRRETTPAHERPDLPVAPTGFSRRVWTATLIVTAVGGGILLLWLAHEVALLFFAGVLLAIFLRTLADWVGRFTHLSRSWSLAVTIAVLLGIIVGACWLLATPVMEQVQRLSNDFPKAIERMEQNLSQYSWGKSLVAKLQNPTGVISQNGGMMQKLSAVFTISVRGIIDFWVIIFCGFYFAVQPELYVNGFLRMVPVRSRDRAREILYAIGHDLRRWIFGQIVSMIIIGSLTWLGLHLLRVEAAQMLGLLAGVLDFVPVAGPWVAGLASAMIALLKSPMHAIFVVCLFVGLHLLEGHVIIPLVQREATRLPPTLTVLAMVLFYMLFGFLGLLVATPLLVVTMVATRMIFVEGVIERQPAG